MDYVIRSTISRNTDRSKWPGVNCVGGVHNFQVQIDPNDPTVEPIVTARLSHNPTVKYHCYLSNKLTHRWNIIYQCRVMAWPYCAIRASHESTPNHLTLFSIVENEGNKLWVRKIKRIKGIVDILLFYLLEEVVFTKCSRKLKLHHQRSCSTKEVVTGAILPKVRAISNWPLY